MAWLHRGATFVAIATVIACGSSGDEVQHSGGEGGGVITGAGGAATVSASSGVTAQASSSASNGAGGHEPLGPPYPVVFAHGFFGFEEFAGLDFATYFYEVKEHFAQKGETVYTPAVDPFNDSTYRGAQLAEHIQQILRETGRAKVNIIGHSQGGLDARVVAHDYPDLVASVTTVATPHLGTPIADIALGLVDDPVLGQLLDWLLDVVGAPLYDQFGDETSLAKPLHEFSQEGIAAFNAHYTDSPSVLYLSLSGRSDLAYGAGDCDPDTSLSFISAFKTELDPIDPLLSLTEAVLDGGIGEAIANDGMVRVKDARWGEFLGCVPADHLDEVGHLLGDAPGGANGWDYMAFYDALVAELRKRGL